MNNLRLPVVFVSHASTDAEVAWRVAVDLKKHGISVREDQEICVGEDFVQFMNEALQESDHCLVLWSKNVLLKSYVGREISAAFVLDVKHRPSYLLFARLDDTPLPPLFSPRLSVDLALDWERGMRKILDVVARDIKVSTSTGKPIVAPLCFAPELPLGDESIEVYVCSAVFERTVVLVADLREDPDAFLGNVLRRFDAPNCVDHNRRIGVRINYFLRGPKGPLLPGFPLSAQGINDGTVIWLELECEPFVMGKKIDSEHPGRTRYRLQDAHSLIMPEAVLHRALHSAAEALSESLRRIGLRRDTPIPITMLNTSRRRSSGLG